jgi:DNA-binding transcriptional LysR family regulator
MNIDHLRYILEVEKQGSISKAAKVLYLNQPYLSKVIQEVENDLGLKIFKRSHHGMEVTNRGQEVIAKIENIIKDFNELSHLSSLEETLSFHVAVPSSSVFVEVLKELIYQNKESSYHIHYEEEGPKNIIEKVSNGDVDFGILRCFDFSEVYYENQLLYRNIKSSLLSTSKLKLLISSHSPHAKKQMLSIGELKNDVHIIHGTSMPGHTMSFVQSLLEKEGVDRSIMVSERETMYSLLSSMDDAFMWSTHLPKSVLDRYDLCLKECNDYEIVIKDFLIYRKGYVFSNEALKYIERLKGALNNEY